MNIINVISRDFSLCLDEDSENDKSEFISPLKYHNIK